MYDFANAAYFLQHVLYPILVDITMSHLNSGFDLKGKSIQNCYVFTYIKIVSHLEGSQGENCTHYMAMY